MDDDDDDGYYYNINKYIYIYVAIMDLPGSKSDLLLCLRLARVTTGMTTAEVLRELLGGILRQSAAEQLLGQCLGSSRGRGAAEPRSLQPSRGVG